MILIMFLQMSQNHKQLDRYVHWLEYMYFWVGELRMIIPFSNRNYNQQTENQTLKSESESDSIYCYKFNLFWLLLLGHGMAWHKIQQLAVARETSLVQPYLKRKNIFFTYCFIFPSFRMFFCSFSISVNFLLCLAKRMVLVSQRQLNFSTFCLICFSSLLHYANNDLYH